VIAETGYFALLLALAVAAAQAVVPLIGARRGDAQLMDFARAAAQAQFGFIALAFACLTWAFVVSDFTVSLVVQSSHSAKPLLYKFSGVWGNHEGSMVLWVLILALFGAAIATFGDNLPPALRARVLAVQAMIGVAFLAFIVFTSNPFQRVFPPPADGNGLNPLLQDPGLAFHPPLLYLGAAMDARRVGSADSRHRPRQLVGVLRARLGRLVVLGPGRERLVHAVADRDCPAAFGNRRREARRAEELDRAARHPCLLAVTGRYVPGALGRAQLGACLRR
jgi:hypothetical protein